MKELLHIEHLTKELDSFYLEDVNLRLETGYVQGLIGVNGTGKTTLIRTILNIYEKDSGKVSVCGFLMDEDEMKAKDRIGVVLDKNMFEEDFSVIKNAEYFGKMYSKFDMEIFKELCRRFQIPLQQKIRKLSTGFKIRFQLAFALSHDADLFIMDEPASGLDPVFRKELMGYIQEIVEDGTRSVLLSTHITEDLDRIGDYVALMKNGRIVLNTSVEEMKERYLFIYGTKEEIEGLQVANIIYKEYREFQNYAFVKKEETEDYSRYETRRPLLDEIMFCLEKGGYEYV